MDGTHPTRSRAVDVAVVGAGVIGLSTAWALRAAGLTVAVIDPAPGQGASRAAAGMIAPASETRYQQAALLGLMRAAAEEYPAFVAQVEEAGSCRVGYHTTETLVCAADPADRLALTELRQYQASHGMHVEMVTSRRARELEPSLSPRLAGAFLVPGDHQVDPRRLVAGLVTALTTGEGAAGVRMIEGEAVELLSSPRGGVTGVRLADGSRVTAGETVLAPGVALARIAGLPATARLPVRQVHGDIVRTRLPEGAPTVLERTVRGLVGGRPIYLVPRTDGEIVIGATQREDGRDRPSAGGVHRLLHDAQTLVPAVADLELSEVMARARPGTPDDRPLLGRVRGDDGEPLPGLVVSTGYFRHGVLLAPLAARLTAQLVSGDDGGGTPADPDHLAAVDPQRFDLSDPSPETTHSEVHP